MHFNGLMNVECKAGVNYIKTFGQPLIQTMPCIRGNNKGVCNKCKFLSPDEVKTEVERITADTTKHISVLITAKNHYKKTKLDKAKVKCPNGDHEFAYVRASTNGHFWIACKECQISMME